ncbi:hypothetical protein FRC03_003620 [Tulasnella sp. 419]|nr:hypothetical protein FRC03_003620 [Tulasnella sp. 419]
MLSLSRYSLAFCILWLWVEAAYLNTTVDDASPSFIYLPETGAWTKNGFCAEGVCWAAPNPNMLYGQTWHETTRYDTSPPFNISLKFDGVAVSVYGVFWDAPTIARIDLKFDVDNGMKTGSFVRESKPISKDSFTYDQLVFSADNLYDGEHNMLISMQPNSWFMFDRVVVTKTTPDTTATISWPSDGTLRSIETSVVGQSPASSRNNNRTAVIGGAVGGALGGILIGVLIAFLLFRRRRAKEPHVQLWVDEPFDPFSPSPAHHHDQPSQGQFQTFNPWLLTPGPPTSSNHSSTVQLIPPAAYPLKSISSSPTPSPPGAGSLSHNPYDLPPRYEDHYR